MEAVILKAFSDVDGFDASCFFEASDIEDELVGAAGIRHSCRGWGSGGADVT